MEEKEEKGTAPMWAVPIVYKIFAYASSEDSAESAISTLFFFL
jgi:hypothetical protein